MQLVRTAAELPKPTSCRAFVPTMGALHEGHLSLIRLAQQYCQEVVVSVFVNPKQFGPREDLDHYPRQEERDQELCEGAGVAYFFAPSVEEVYPYGMNAATIHIDEVGDSWEGAMRPGHFDGVSTVVSKLCHMVRPSILFLGQKDLQQAAVIERMIASLNEPYSLIIGPTYREKDGLAMSSRNAYLSQEEREIAPEIYRVLSWVKLQLLSGVTAESVIVEAKAKLAEHFDVQYLALIDRRSLVELNALNEQAALIVAAYLGKTRLIDNILI